MAAQQDTAMQPWCTAYVYTGTNSDWYEYICKYVINDLTGHYDKNSTASKGRRGAYHHIGHMTSNQLLFTGDLHSKQPASLLFTTQLMTNKWKRKLKLTASASCSLEVFFDRRLPRLMNTLRWLGAMRVV